MNQNNQSTTPLSPPHSPGVGIVHALDKTLAFFLADPIILEIIQKVSLFCFIATYILVVVMDEIIHFVFARERTPAEPSDQSFVVCGGTVRLREHPHETAAFCGAVVGDGVEVDKVEIQGKWIKVSARNATGQGWLRKKHLKRTKAELIQEWEDAVTNIRGSWRSFVQTNTRQCLKLVYFTSIDFLLLEAVSTGGFRNSLLSICCLHFAPYILAFIVSMASEKEYADCKRQCFQGCFSYWFGGRTRHGVSRILTRAFSTSADEAEILSNEIQIFEGPNRKLDRPTRLSVLVDAGFTSEDFHFEVRDDAGRKFSAEQFMSAREELEFTPPLKIRKLVELDVSELVSAHSIYYNVNAGIPRLLLTFTGQLLLFLMYLDSLYGRIHYDKQSMNYAFWFIAVIIVQCGYLVLSGSAQAGAFWQSKLWGAMLNPRHYVWHPGNPKKGVRASIVNKGFLWILCVMSFVVKALIREMVIVTIPVLLMFMETTLDFVKDAFAVIFILNLDEENADVNIVVYRPSPAARIGEPLFIFDDRSSF